MFNSVNERNNNKSVLNNGADLFVLLSSMAELNRYYSIELLATDEASSVAFCFGGVCKFERHRKAKPNFSQRYTKDYN